MRRSVFSTITMASSTTKPTDSTIANRVSRLIVKPKICMMNTAPISDSGIDTMGTSTVRSEPMKRKITMMTMTSVSISVLTTSRMAVSM